MPVSARLQSPLGVDPDDQQSDKGRASMGRIGVVGVLDTVKQDVQCVRAVVENLYRDVPANVPGMSRRVAIELRQKVRRQLRVSAVAAGLWCEWAGYLRQFRLSGRRRSRSTARRLFTAAKRSADLLAYC